MVGYHGERTKPRSFGWLREAPSFNSHHSSLGCLPIIRFNSFSCLFVGWTKTNVLFTLAVATVAGQ